MQTSVGRTYLYLWLSRLLLVDCWVDELGFETPLLRRSSRVRHHAACWSDVVVMEDTHPYVYIYIYKFVVGWVQSISTVSQTRLS